MFCSRCGKEVAEGNQFCQFCGQPVGAAATSFAGNAAPAAIQPPTSFETNAARSSVTPAYAGFWVRFVAHFIDGLVVGIPFGIIAFGVVLMFGGFGAMMHRIPVDPQTGAPPDPRAALAMAAPMFVTFYGAMFFFVILQWLYFTSMESSERQATFGKLALGLRVVDSEGQRLSFAHAAGRSFAKIVTWLVPFGIGYIIAGFTAKKQALHDFIAGTLVLKG